MDSIGQILEIWRYPVSSIGGERVPHANLSFLGVEGDRQYALIDLVTGLPAAPEKEKRWRKALYLTANCMVGELPMISFPDQRSYWLNDPFLEEALSDFFGFSTAVATYDHVKNPCDFPLTQYRHPHAPVHLLTTSSLAQLAKLMQVERVDCRRFRPTALIELKHSSGFVENQWTGQRMKLGDIQLMDQEPTARCGMTLISQPDLEENPEILRNILRHNKRNLGTYCSIERAGQIEVGDELFI